MTNPMKAYLKFLSKAGRRRFRVSSAHRSRSAEYFGIGVGIGLRKGNEELTRPHQQGHSKTMTDDGSLEVYALKHFPFAIHPQKWQGTG